MSLYQSDRLLGRSAEETILLNSYFASLTKGKNSPASVVLIHGDSGLGKTKLAESLRPHVLGDEGYFVRGKFDQLSYGSASRPYAGISSAFAEYCSAVEQRGDEELTEVATKLRREVDAEEGRLLFEAIPSLRNLMGGCHHEAGQQLCSACEYSAEEEGKSADAFSEAGGHRFIYLIKRVVAVISSIGDPIVCLIDDVQWANKTEIEVMKALLAGANNPFLFIFTCRPGDHHPFLEITKEVGKTEIMLQSLERNAVRELVGEILRIDDVEDCTALANFISRVTNGNPFFIRQQVIALRDEGLLRFGNEGWVWDIDEIEGVLDEASGIENVVVMLMEKMKKLPFLTQEVLKICACIGSRIDLYMLGLLIREERSFVDGPDRSDVEENETAAKMAISVASQEGLVAITENGEGVTFTHDSVREAAYSLLEPGEQESYHLKFGQILQRKLCQDLLEKYIYTIAAQFARGIDLINAEEDRIATAGIFLSAGEKSRKAAAFPESHFFFSKGINLLRENDWTDHYRLCCDLYLKAADTAAIMADFRDMDRCLAIVFDRCKNSLVDYLHASIIQVRSMHSRDDPNAVNVGMDALRLAGEQFPAKNLLVHSALGFARTTRAMKKIGAEKLHLLPPITDERVMATLHLLHLLIPSAVAWNQALLPLLSTRIIQLNLKFGMSEAMPIAVALYGAALCRRGFSLKEAARFGEAAWSVQRTLESNGQTSLLALLTYGCNFTLTKNIASECLNPLRQAYETSIKSGDINDATSCVSSMGLIAFFSGQKLTKVGTILDKLRVSMLEYNVTRGIRINKLHQSAVDYFLGRLNSSRFYAPSEEKNNMILREQAKFLRLVAACIFGDHEVAWSFAEKLGDFNAAFAGTIWPYICAFYRGMAAISILHKLRSRQAIRLAKSCLGELKKGRKKSVANITHHTFLLQAEWAAYKKKYSAATKLYLLAIENAEKASVLHEHA